MHVLLVDDEPDVRVLLRLYIDDRCEDVVIDEASNGVEAVEMTTESRPDVVVMDLRMPVMDGLEATRQIKEVAPETDVVVYTATLGSPHEVREAGASEQFQKGDIEGLCSYLCSEGK